MSLPEANASVSFSPPVLVPQAGSAVSPERRQDLVRQPLRVRLHLPLSSVPFSLRPLVCLLSLSPLCLTSVYFCVSLCQSLSYELYTLSLLSVIYFLLCFHAVFVSLTRGFVCDYDWWWP